MVEQGQESSNGPIAVAPGVAAVVVRAVAVIAVSVPMLAEIFKLLKEATFAASLVFVHGVLT